MALLTEKDVLAMSKKERLTAYENAVDVGCNADIDSIEYDEAHHNQNMLERKIQFNEY